MFAELSQQIRPKSTPQVFKLSTLSYASPSIPAARKRNVPILPKKPSISDVLSAEHEGHKLTHGGVVVGHAICYVCDDYVTKGFRLVEPKSGSTKVGLPSMIAKLMGESFVVVIKDDDVICEHCFNMMTFVRTLEQECLQVKKILRQSLSKKYECNLTAAKSSADKQKTAKYNVELLKKFASSGGTGDRGRLEGKKGGTGSNSVSAVTTRFKCAMCTLEFESNKALKLHVKAHLATWTCHFCNTDFEDQTNFIEHSKTHLADVKKEKIKEELGNEQLLPTTSFSCETCNVVFSKEEDLAYHTESHSSELMDMDMGLMPIELIDQPVTTADLIADNMFVKTGAVEQQSSTPDSFVCAHCELKFTDLAQLTDHFNTVHQLHQCTLCPDLVGNIDEIQTHVSQAHRDQDGSAVHDVKQPLTQTCEEVLEDNVEYLSCGLCGAITDSQEVLDMHVTTCGQEETMEAMETELEEEEVHSVEEGELTQVNLLTGVKKPRQYVCMGCHTIFSSKVALVTHEEEHPEHCEVSCRNCTLTFARERLLNTHREEEHADNMQCRYCNKTFNNVKQIKAHESRHTRSSRSTFQCSVLECGRIFQTSGGLRAHTAEHTGEYKFVCEYCNKGFVMRSPYEEHRATHTKEKRYTCDVCDRSFSVQATYWIHRKWHDNPHPYKCEECGMVFKHSSLLAVHKRKHTGERPYACTYCPESFFVSTSLKRHLSIHTGIYPYNCKECDVGFSAKHKMAAHMSKVHHDYGMLRDQMKNKNREFVMAIKPPTDGHATSSRQSSK